MTSTKRNIGIAFCQSFQNLDAEANVALRAPNCIHTFAPASLNMPQAMTNEQFAAHLLSLKALIAEFPVTAKEIFTNEGSNQVTIWATSNAIIQEEAKDEELDWSYHGEYLFILFLNQDDKIERIIEYLDSTKVVAMKALMARAKSNLAAKKENA